MEELKAPELLAAVFADIYDDDTPWEDMIASALERSGLVLTRALTPSPDAIEASMRAYAEAAMKHGWQAALGAANSGRIAMSWERNWFERNPPRAALHPTETVGERG